MEKRLGIMVCRKLGHLKAVRQARFGAGGGVGVCVLCEAECDFHSLCVLPEGLIICFPMAGPQAVLVPVQCSGMCSAQQWACLLGQYLCWAASWPPGRNRYQVSLLLVWVSHRSGFRWKTYNFWKQFSFCRWKMWRLFHQMGGSQEDRVRICDEVQNDWHVNVAH